MFGSIGCTKVPDVWKCSLFGMSDVRSVDVWKYRMYESAQSSEVFAAWSCLLWEFSLYEVLINLCYGLVLTP